MKERRIIGPAGAETSERASSRDPLPPDPDRAAPNRRGALDERDVGQRWPVRGRGLIGMPVHVDGVEEGRVCDVVLDAGLGRVLGLKVQRTCGRQSFVPWVVLALAPLGAVVQRAHAVMSTTELAFYVDRGAFLTELPEPLCDLVVDRTGEVQEVVTERPAAADTDG